MKSFALIYIYMQIYIKQAIKYLQIKSNNAESKQYFKNVRSGNFEGENPFNLLMSWGRQNTARILVVLFIHNMTYFKNNNIKCHLKLNSGP